MKNKGYPPKIRSKDEPVHTPEQCKMIQAWNKTSTAQSTEKKRKAKFESIVKQDNRTWYLTRNEQNNIQVTQKLQQLTSKKHKRLASTEHNISRHNWNSDSGSPTEPQNRKKRPIRCQVSPPTLCWRLPAIFPHTWRKFDIQFTMTALKKSYEY
jgi:hypothetical protein